MGAYKYFKHEGVESLTIVTDDGSVLSFDSNHPNFSKVKTKVLDNQDYSDLDALLNPGKDIVNKFSKLSTELSIRGGKLFYEGEKLNDVLADKIVRLHESGEDYKPFVLFKEKLQTNPNAHSVEHLYRWLEASDFVIDRDGDIIGYKGVRSDNTSVHAGSVIRNGEPFDGHVLNKPGDVIEMDRNLVTFDPALGCSYGLHVGTWEYASTWSDKVLKVKVNPKYVVSVPTDCNDQKMRVCRYTVLEEINSPIGSEYHGEAEDDDVYENDYYDFDDIPDHKPVVDDPSKIKFSMIRGYPSMNGWPAISHSSLDNKVDTRLNYQNQPRDARGRFVKKSS